MEEVWKDIKGYEGLYQVSSFGRIKGLGRTVVHKNGTKRYYPEMIRKLSVDTTGQYWNVTLSKNGKKKTFNIHSLVAKAFIPNPNNLPLVMHKDQKNLRKDGVCNNFVENLEWGCNVDNMSQEIARKRISEALKGRTLTKEWKEKVNKNRHGKRPVISNGKEFSSVAECARFYSLSKETMRFWLNNLHLMPEFLKKPETRYI